MPLKPFYLIDGEQLAYLERLRTRLHSEERMDGDLMRNAGHVLDELTRVCRQLEVPEDAILATAAASSHERTRRHTHLADAQPKRRDR